MSQPGETADARRLARAALPGDTPRDRLYILPHPDRHVDEQTSTIWHGDPESLSPELTTVADWPMPREFAPLIKAAQEAGNLQLVRQLREDQRYCRDMRRKLRIADRLSRDSERVAP